MARVRHVRLDEGRLEEARVKVAITCAALTAARSAARWCFPLAPRALPNAKSTAAPASSVPTTASINIDAWPRSQQPLWARLDRRRGIDRSLSPLVLRLNGRRQQRVHERLTAQHPPISTPCDVAEIRRLGDSCAGVCRLLAESVCCRP
jgi:hypothetical protein